MDRLRRGLQSTQHGRVREVDLAVVTTSGSGLEFMALAWPTMRCANFQLIVQMIARAPSFRLLDVAAEETVAQRRQAKEEQNAAAEAATEEPAEAPATRPR